MPCHFAPPARSDFGGRVAGAGKSRPTRVRRRKKIEFIETTGVQHVENRMRRPSGVLSRGISYHRIHQGKPDAFSSPIEWKICGQTKLGQLIMDRRQLASSFVPAADFENIPLPRNLRNRLSRAAKYFHVEFSLGADRDDAPFCRHNAGP